MPTFTKYVPSPTQKAKANAAQKATANAEAIEARKRAARRKAEAREANAGRAAYQAALARGKAAGAFTNRNAQNITLDAE